MQKQKESTGKKKRKIGDSNTRNVNNVSKIWEVKRRVRKKEYS